MRSNLEGNIFPHYVLFAPNSTKESGIFGRTPATLGLLARDWGTNKLAAFESLDVSLGKGKV
jgi:hypothetical protein